MMQKLNFGRSLCFIGLFLLIGNLGIRPLQAANAVVGTGTPASCTEAAFNTALATVQGSVSGTITFNCGGAATILFSGSKIITNANVTIDGVNTITLNGGNTVRHFYVDSNATLTVKNIILKNGYDNTFGGGSILSLGGLTLNNATIRDSNVDSGHSGGAIMIYKPVTIVNSLIENNTGGSAGGLFLFGETADATITGSTFRNNRTTSVTYGLGGAITTWNGADVTLQNATLTQNQARLGGGIYNEHPNTSILIEQNSVLSENMALSSDSGGGGGISNFFGQLTMTRGELTGNSSSYNGGGLYNASSASVVLTNVTISNNTAVNAGGGIYNENGSVTILATVLSYNTATYGGGLLHQGNVPMNISDTVLSHNSAPNGGGIHLNNGPLTLSHTVLSYNPATDGGGIMNFGNLDLSNVTISGNSATRKGGGIYTFGRGGYLPKWL